VNIPKLHGLIITGGHGFREEPFFEMFDSFENFSYDAVVFPEAFEKLTPESAEPYDALIFYDMWPEITPEQQSAFLNILRQGKGIVSLHHTIISYRNWEEYPNIIGGRYSPEPQIRDGVEIPAGTFKHGVQFTVNIADPNHPITQGLQDFEIVDETYNNFWVSKDAHVLLTTEHPDSGPVIGWTNHYGNSKVVYIQLGHDELAYGNESYRRLVHQAICWAAG